jgi:hypothetical protein
MSTILIKFKNINKFFGLFGGYDYDDCCCGGSCGCCGGGHSASYTSLAAEKGIQLFGGYDYDDCCCGGSCGCCGSGHSSKVPSETKSSSFILNTKRADVPLAWGLYFQDGASPSFEGIVDLHNRIMFYLVVILFGVTWIMLSIMWNFNNSKNKLVYRYLNHGTLIELIWTVGPALVLVAIAFPSFKLLYLMDIHTLSLLDYSSK